MRPQTLHSVRHEEAEDPEKLCPDFQLQKLGDSKDTVVESGFTVAHMEINVITD